MQESRKQEKSELASVCVSIRIAIGTMVKQQFMLPIFFLFCFGASKQLLRAIAIDGVCVCLNFVRLLPAVPAIVLSQGHKFWHN